MMVLGDAGLWADTFPGDLVPRILDLVMETWLTFPKPTRNDKEVPITQRFRQALIHARDVKKLPVTVLWEVPVDDPATAEELGRLDLRFSSHLRIRENIYFSFECKRMNVVENGSQRPYAAEYVTEGMMRYIIGRYAAQLELGGMIGYVLDGKCDNAMNGVESNIRRNCCRLKMDKPGVLAKSSLRPDQPYIRETQHRLPALFRMHHVFLAGILPSAKATKKKKK